MAKKVPPPPPLATNNPQFNRWLLELTSILSNTGGINPSEVTGLPAVITQVGTNTTAISALQGTTGGQGTQITALQNRVTVTENSIATINGQITTLSSRAQVFNGTGAPNAGLGNNGDWFLNTAGAAGSKLWLKSGGTWTAYL